MLWGWSDAGCESRLEFLPCYPSLQYLSPCCASVSPHISCTAGHSSLSCPRSLCSGSHHIGCSKELSAGP